MEKEDYSIEISLADESAQMLDVLNKEVYLKEEKTETILGEKELPVTAVYENKESASIALTSTADSVKETITLFKKPKSNILTYTLSLGNLTARKNVLDEGITYYDKDKNIQIMDKLR